MAGFSPAQALRPTALPKALESDFLDPTVDGSDVAWYATDFINVAPLSNQNFSTIKIDAGVDFYWMMTTLQADIAGHSLPTGPLPYTQANILVPTLNIRIRDEASGANFQNLRTPMASLAGFGERCYRLIQPRRVPGSTILSLAITSLDPTNTYANVFVVLHGYIFPAANLQG